MFISITDNKRTELMKQYQTAIKSANAVGRVKRRIGRSEIDRYRIKRHQANMPNSVRTPFQGMNRLLGKPGGFKRGEMAVIVVKQRSYKTGQGEYFYDPCTL